MSGPALRSLCLVLAWNYGLQDVSRCGPIEGAARGGNATAGWVIMTPRRKRLLVVLGILGGVGASVSLAFMASRENIMFYYDPSQVVGVRRQWRSAPHGAWS